MNGFARALRFARRDLRSGLANFRIFLASLTLGVAAIAGVGSLGQAFLTGLDEQGRTLLGGDVEIQRLYQPASGAEHQLLARFGEVSSVTSMRGIAQTADSAKRALIEIKAGDNTYPLLGSVVLEPAFRLADALDCEGGVCGAVVENALLQRLGVAIGNRIRIGNAEFQIRATIVSEPDRVAGGFTLGPQVMLSQAELARSGLVTEGSLITYSYRVAFAGAATIPQFRSALISGFPDAAWDIHDRTNAVPQITRFVRQATMFLTLIGLTALVVGGVGAGQAVSAFIERRRATIATLKALGAEGDEIFLIYMIQVLAVAALGILMGLVIGAALPFAVQKFAGDSIPAPAHYAIYFGPLLLAAAFGFLAAFGFAILPLARAREIAPASLFRDLVAPSAVHGRWTYRLAALGCFGAIVALAVALSPYKLFTLEFLAGAAGVLIALRVAGTLLRRGLAHLPHGNVQILRLARDNLTRPGTPTGEIIVALGLGLTLLAMVTLIQGTVNAQVRDSLPSRVPSFFFVDIQKAQYDAFKALVSGFPTASDFDATPSLRGRIVKLKGVPVAQAQVDRDARGLLNGDRGVTYADSPPKNSNVVQGQWWAKDYRGPTLVSFSADFARRLHLQIGDQITINLLGREFDVTIANLRQIDFSTGGINFFMIFSPGTIDAAPHDYLATVRVAGTQEEAMFAAVTGKFPNITVVRVKDALAQVYTIVQTLARAIAAASAVTILAGILVLAGAIASGHRARLYEAVLLKVLGATRARLAAIYAIEYGLLGALAGVAALGAGTIAAWAIARFVFDVPFVFEANAVAVTILGGAAGTLVLGLASGFAALSAKPAARLRNP